MALLLSVLAWTSSVAAEGPDSSCLLQTMAGQNLSDGLSLPDGLDCVLPGLSMCKPGCPIFSLPRSGLFSGCSPTDTGMLVLPRHDQGTSHIPRSIRRDQHVPVPGKLCRGHRGPTHQDVGRQKLHSPEPRHIFTMASCHGDRVAILWGRIRI